MEKDGKEYFFVRHGIPIFRGTVELRGCVQTVHPSFDGRSIRPGGEPPPVEPVARACHVAQLCPIPELAEVANGITVLPVKSLLFTKLLTGHAAIPHQMG